MSEPPIGEMVLDVKGLQTVFFTASGLFRAVDDVSFTVRRGETLAIVGESGCGKSVTALSVMRLVPDPPGRIVGGSIVLEGTDLLDLDEDEMRKIRGNRISMIFQEPMTSLNPVMRIGDQIAEAVRLHRNLSSTEAKNIAVECGGVTVRPGVIQLADEDGVVVVPQDRASEVLKEAQSIDARESGMYPFIRQFKSLQEAIKKFNRI